MFLADHFDESVRGHPLLLGLEHDGRPVAVVRAHIDAVMTQPALEPHPDVGLDVFHHVPDMDRTVRVGKCARHQRECESVRT